MGMIYLFSNTPKKGVKHVKILRVNFLRPNNFTSCEDFQALIFTSKNAVLALDGLDKSWKKLPSFCIGEATAKKVKELDGKVEFICTNSYGDEFAHQIKPLLNGKKILFPRAKEVVSNIKEILMPLQVDEIIVYESICSECESIKQPPLKSTLIFTSPSSVKCFLKCFKLHTSYDIICIGEKTVSQIPQGFVYKIPQTQNIDECIKMAKGEI